MMSLSVMAALEALDVRWSVGAGSAASLRVSGVSSDTRSLVPGQAYFGLVGPRFDGAAFAADAAAGGATLIVLTDGPKNRATLEELVTRRGPAARMGNTTGSLVGVVVEDTTRALGALALATRESIEAPVIAITGSCGKTSTKSMLHALLQTSFRTVSSPASFNNSVGVPHSIFLADERTEALVLEVGTNGPGEIEGLARIARPDVSVITNIGRSHLEGLGSEAGVAAEKSALFAALDPASGRSTRAHAVVNLDDRFASRLLEAVPAGARVSTFSTAGRTDATFHARSIEPRAEGTAFELVGPAGAARAVSLPLLGRHAVANFLAAIAAAHAIGADLDAAIAAAASLQPARHRLETFSAGGLCCIDDTYNANPESVGAALDVLAGLVPDGGRRFLVLGAMAELGARSVELHERVGAAAARCGADGVCLVGADDVKADLDAYERGLLGAQTGGALFIERCSTCDEAADWIARCAGAGDVVLAKASRSQRLERVFDALNARVAVAAEVRA